MSAARAGALCWLCAGLMACSKTRASVPRPTPDVTIGSASPSATQPLVASSSSPVSSALCASPSGHVPIKPELRRPPAMPGALAAKPGVWLADERYANLSSTPEPTWAEGPASYVGRGTAVRGVVLGRLPKSLRAWLGRSVRVLGAGGAVCDTRLQRFAIRAEVTPDPATAEVWEGCADPPLAPSAIAEDIWRASAGSGRALVAEFSATCRGALLAIDPDLPAPMIAAPEPASAELGERALRAFRQLPAYAELQARYEAELPSAQGAWEDHDARRGVWSLRLPTHTPLVLVSVEAGARCAKFSGSLSALWAESAAGAPLTLNLLVIPKALDQQRLTPSAVVDLDASGSPAVLLGPDGEFAARTLLTKARAWPRAGYDQILLSGVPFFAGPC